MTVASRVAVMDEGRLIQVATPPEIYEQPATTYVADFIGDVSLIEGRARAAGDRVEIDWAEGQKPIVATTDAALSAGQSVHFAIRPEKVHISKERDESRPNLLQGRVEDIAYLGNISTYHVRLPDGTLLKAQSTNHRRLANRGITWEDEVYLSFTETAGVVLTA